MPLDLSNQRNEYVGHDLRKTNVDTDPYVQFRHWIREALESKLIYEPTAMTLATVSSGGQPSARIVLLKGFDHNGFVFYTNYESHKADDLAANPNASLLFFWDQLHRQVHIEGVVARVDEQESRDYFRTRPRDSQIAAWTSKQSAVIADRAALDDAYARYEQEFQGAESIDMPQSWGGYRLAPTRFEFWQGQEGRMHDRLQYAQDGDSWSIDRLSP